VGPTQRLNELLDNIRTEFETESQRSVDYENQSKSLFVWCECLRRPASGPENRPGHERKHHMTLPSTPIAYVDSVTRRGRDAQRAWRDWYSTALA